jgi:hypothetical protein
MNAQLLTYSLYAGLIFSAGMSALLLATALINPEMLVNDYPPDIRERFGIIGTRAKRQRSVSALLFLAWTFGGLILTLRGAAALAGGALTFWQAALTVFVLFGMFNLIDLLILDWLIFVKICPARFVLPGTAGMAGYKDYGFHFRGFLIGNVIITAFSLLAAGVTMGIN